MRGSGSEAVNGRVKPTNLATAAAAAAAPAPADLPMQGKATELHPPSLQQKMQDSGPGNRSKFTFPARKPAAAAPLIQARISAELC